jgi:AcrR family transcriptional regulator
VSKYASSTININVNVGFINQSKGFNLMKKQPELTAQTKENLMEAFWGIYCGTRIEKVTIKDIAAKAGYNRSTFYEYFTDVYDVLEQIENAVLPSHEGLMQHDPAAMTNSSLPIDELTQIYEKNKKYYVVLFGENGDPSFQNKFKNYMKAMVKQHLASEGKAETFEIEFALEFMLSALIGALTYWFSLDSPPSTNKLFELMGELIHNGLMPVFAGERGKI